MVRVATAKHNRERGVSRWFVCMREASGVVAGWGLRLREVRTIEEVAERLGDRNLI